jgi:hypothetical protein
MRGVIAMILSTIFVVAVTLSVEPPDCRGAACAVKVAGK